MRMCRIYNWKMIVDMYNSNVEILKIIAKISFPLPFIAVLSILSVTYPRFQLGVLKHHFSQTKVYFVASSKSLILVNVNFMFLSSILRN